MKLVSNSKISNKDPECSQNSSASLTSLPIKNESIASNNFPNIYKKTNNFKNYYRNEKHLIWCQACFKSPNLIKAFSEKIQIPNIAQECGTIYRKEYVDKHLATKNHKQCEKTLILSILSVLNAGESSSMGHFILKSQSKDLQGCKKVNIKCSNFSYESNNQ